MFAAQLGSDHTEVHRQERTVRPAWLPLLSCTARYIFNNEICSA